MNIEQEIKELRGQVEELSQKVVELIQANVSNLDGHKHTKPDSITLSNSLTHLVNEAIKDTIREGKPLHL
ncbi:hypothetical protein [Rosenbergiella epipactidis]|uniref:hypothetical protein n=1 Tax=Rosenbergiella epipactidis TaxID=1544694 RepID=UPI001F4DCF6B|nr:hypothetical protein [Rosenbergiella epipactidis]